MLVDEQVQSLRKYPNMKNKWKVFYLNFVGRFKWICVCIIAKNRSYLALIKNNIHFPPCMDILKLNIIKLMFNCI